VRRKTFDNRLVSKNTKVRPSVRPGSREPRTARRAHDYRIEPSLHRYSGFFGNNLATRKIVAEFKIVTENVTAFLKVIGDMEDETPGRLDTTSATAASMTINIARVGGSLIAQPGIGLGRSFSSGVLFASAIH